jgi:hypothetical protein
VCVYIYISFTLREEHGLRVFESEVLRRTFGPKRDELTGTSRNMCNEELYNTFLKISG